MNDANSRTLDHNLNEQVRDTQPRPSPKCVPREQPDRGWAWVVFIASCIVHFMVFGMHYSFGVLFPRLLSEFKQGESRTAWVGSLSSGSLFFGSIMAVKLSDMTNVGVTCMSGAILSGLGLILTATVQNFSLLYLTHSFLFGIGTSLLYTPSLIVIARWFERWRHFITGIVVAAGSFGQVVMSPTLQYCLDVFGLRTTFKMAGAAFAISTALCSCAFYPKRDDLYMSKQTYKKSVYNLNFKLLLDKAFVVWVAVMMITNFSYYIPLIHLMATYSRLFVGFFIPNMVPGSTAVTIVGVVLKIKKGEIVNYAQHLGATDKQSSLLLTCMAISGILGRIFFGRIANYNTNWTCRIYQIAMFMSGVCTLIFSSSAEFWHLLLYTVFYGFLDGSFIGLMSLVTLEIVKLEDLGQGWGLMLFSIAVPIALGPPTVGWINDSKAVDGHYMFLVAGFPVILGSLLMFLVLRWKKKKSSGKYSVASTKSSIDFEDIDDNHRLLQLVSVL